MIRGVCVCMSRVTKETVDFRICNICNDTKLYIYMSVSSPFAMNDDDETILFVLIYLTPTLPRRRRRLLWIPIYSKDDSSHWQL